MRILGILSAAIICLTAILQGGFYVNVSVIVSVAVYIAFLIKGKVSVKEVLILSAVYALMLVSCAVGGFSVFGVQRSIPAVCCVLYGFSVRAYADKYSILKYVMFFAAALSGVCILSYCGLFFEISGNVSAGRMNMTFQYANAAGIFNAVMLMLAMTELKQYERRLAPLFLTAVFLTKSVGALAVCFVGVCILWYKKCINAKKAELGIVAAVISVILILSRKYANIPVAAVGCTVLAVYCIFSKETERFNAKIYVMLFAAVLLAAIIVAPKTVSSAQTFAERIIQIKDGLSCCIQNRFLGIGNGNWQYMKGYFQSAQYEAVIIHSTPIHFMVEYGILPTIAVAGIVIIGIHRADKLEVKVILAMLALHYMFDITGSFQALNLLFALLYAYSSDRPVNSAKNGKIAFSVLTAAVVGVSVFATALSQIIDTDMIAGNYKKVCHTYTKYENILKNDKETTQKYYMAKYFDGDMKGVLSYKAPYMWKEMVFTQIKAYSDEQTEEKLDLLLETAQKQPYCVEYYNAAYELLPYVGGEYAERYNELAERANSKKSLLKNQKKINYYGGITK